MRGARDPVYGDDRRRDPDRHGRLQTAAAARGIGAEVGGAPAFLLLRETTNGRIPTLDWLGLGRISAVKTALDFKKYPHFYHTEVLRVILGRLGNTRFGVRRPSESIRNILNRLRLCEELPLLKFGRGERIRTSDLTVPNRTRYQTAPRPARNQGKILT